MRVVAALRPTVLVIARDDGTPGQPVLTLLVTHEYEGVTVQDLTPLEAMARFSVLCKTLILEHRVQHVVTDDTAVVHLLEGTPLSVTVVASEAWLEELGDTSEERVEVGKRLVDMLFPDATTVRSNDLIATICLLYRECVDPGGFAPRVETPKVVCGIDPGSSHVGVAIVREDDALALRETVEVGHTEFLAQIRVVERKDGTQHVRRTKRVIDADDLVRLLGRIRDIWQEYAVERVVLEWVENVHAYGDGAQSGGVATAIAKAQWVGGAIAGMALEMGLDVRYVTARTWVAKVTKGNQAGHRGVVADAVEARYPELKGASDEHKRDAVGLCMYDRLLDAPPPKPEPPPAKKPAPAPKEKLPRQRAGKSAREAAGCTCTSPRHRVGCVLYVPKVYKNRSWKG